MNILNKIKQTPEAVNFKEVIDYINENYSYTPAHFTNGMGNEQVINEAGTNEGSCKIFAFALIENLTTEQTLQCFGEYYRVDVLEHPENDDHQNIRQFIKHDFNGLKFDSQALL